MKTYLRNGLRSISQPLSSFMEKPYEEGPFRFSFLHLLKEVSDRFAERNKKKNRVKGHGGTPDWTHVFRYPRCILCGGKSEKSPVPLRDKLTLLTLNLSDKPELYFINKFLVTEEFQHQTITFLVIEFEANRCHFFACETCYQNLNTLLVDWKAQILPSFYWNPSLLLSFKEEVGKEVYSLYLSSYHSHLNVLLRDVTSGVKDVADLILQYAFFMDFCEIMKIVQSVKANSVELADRTGRKKRKNLEEQSWQQISKKRVRKK